jgi:DNA polymerase I-like protein with 3'-5' exonuclease and polymerase domains
MDRIIFDIEGDALNEINIGKTVTPEATRVWCLVAMDEETGEIRCFREKDMIQAIALLREASVLIGHNIIMYDIPVLERLYGPINTPAIDTLIISKLMYPDIRNHPLKGNSLQQWGEHLNILKTEYSGGFSEYSEDMLEYCKQDVLVSKEIYEAQKSFMKYNRELVNLEHHVSVIISKQIENGIGFDINTAEKLERDLLMEKASIEDELCNIFPPIVTERWSKKTGKRLKDSVEFFNPNSRQQIARRLKDKYGWIAPKTEKGNPNVDEGVLKKLSFPEASMLCRSFEITKLHGMLSDWIIRSSLSRDGRIHGSVNPQGAVTGRMTASQPNLQQVGSNSEVRCLFGPKEGWVQVGIDASGLEARLLANRMAEWDEGEYGELVLHGDIHSYNQKQAGLATRDEAKTFFYALVYGAGNKKIGDIIHKGASAGASLKKKFLDNMPALKNLMKKCEFDVAKEGCIQLLDGRKVPCRSKHSSLNVQIQGDGAVIMKKALILFYNKLVKEYPGKFKFMATVHDEWQVECSPEIAEDVGKAGVQAIKEAGAFYNCFVKMDGEYKIGSNWSECH